MPPKQQQKASSSKVKDDKTFGLKNKNKSAKVQKDIARIQSEQSRVGKNKQELEKEKERALRAKEKADEEKRKKEEGELLKPVQVAQKIPFGVDPKTVLCVYFKAGNCDKGNKCKFSHDRNVERKQEKKDVYSDSRDDKAEDTMDKWDQEKLQSVILSKHGNPKTTTDIVCKFFIDAIESGKFGWFWECPNGEKCMYRHALPPGFILRSEKKAAEDAAKANTISLEEFLEVERHKLGSNLTPVTPETFAVWKKTRLDRKAAQEDAMRKAKDAQAAAGKNIGMSGRDLFQYNPEWFEQDSDEEPDWDFSAYRREKQVEDDQEEQEEQEVVRKFNETNTGEEGDEESNVEDKGKQKET
ncbi:CCCH finger DNA-binding protein, putative [Rhizoctonia solani AG-3 Rhs1AP]|uniref:CCCH finger DNA-binding protein, putative n=2 Tax=Rhizoctonia solani AG-3 TaxID=1086053 RepID=X8J4U0_9AGAM|nr:CCCH finger DNA-binding protein, putative [Rhizoctonia solani AG-3 Rhs1AP]KEP53068.1 putative CCCH finger DNA-binding protein [Rhizoctonia solani 123E]